jgi:osmotically-inducible protein OsmY
MSDTTIALNDAEVAHDVLEEMLWDTSLDSSRINVTAEGGTVVLIGFVDTYVERMTAEERAWGISGVRHVRNELVVDLAAREVLDADLASAARAGLDANSLVPEGAVSVTVADGWVTMTGNVRHYLQRMAAEHVVSHLRGLRGFADDVTVSPEPAQEVSAGVKDSLTRNAAVDADGITVTDHAGVVTLDGTVGSYTESLEAERAAGRAPGVVQITNNLIVAP